MAAARLALAPACLVAGLCVSLFAGGSGAWAEPGQPVACEVTGFDSPVARPPAAALLRFDAGGVAEVRLRASTGAESVTPLMLLRPGVSVRTALRPWPQDPARWMAIFNLVTVEAAGTVLIDTWVTHSIQPDAPQHTWMRLACPGQG